MSNFPDGLTSEHLFDVHVELEAPEAVGATPFGGRSIFIVKSGTVAEPKLSGSFLPGGGDWFLQRSDGVGELDVRATIKADDGAHIYMSYRGVLDASRAVVGRIFGGEDVPLSEFYFRTTPRFETGAEQYAWLNKLVCAAVGYFGPGKVGYRVFGIL